MDRDIPTFNKIIMRQIHQKNMQTHYKNLISIRKSKKVKMNSSSTTLGKVNSKANQIQQQKQTEIDKNNVMLFQKMSKILKRDDPLNKSIAFRNAQRKPNPEFDRIYEENKKLVDRLSHLKPTIDHKRLEEERKKQLNILKFIGKYSPNAISMQQHLAKCRQSFKIGKLQENEQRYRFKTEHFRSEEDEPESKFVENWNISINPRPKYNRQKNVFKLDPKEGDKKEHIHSSLTSYQQVKQQGLIGHQSSQLQSRNINLFKTIKRMNQSSYCISIIRTHQHYEVIAEQLLDDGQYYKIKLDQTKGNQLLESIDYDYEVLLENLTIEHHQLKIAENLTFIKDSAGKPRRRETPQMAIRKISQMVLPSHITELNEEEFSIQQQTTITNHEKFEVQNFEESQRQDACIC